MIISKDGMKQKLNDFMAAAGHPGINSVKRHLRAKYCFAGMDFLVQEHIGACHACNVNTDKSNQEPLRPTVSPSEAWSSGVGIVGYRGFKICFQDIRCSCCD